MNNQDHLEIMDLDLDGEEDVCVPTEEELEEDIMDPCFHCPGC